MSVSENKIWIGQDGEKYGPYTETNVRKWIAEGKFNHDTVAWRSGMEAWVLLVDMVWGSVPNFSAAPNEAPFDTKPEKRESSPYTAASNASSEIPSSRKVGFTSTASSTGNIADELIKLSALKSEGILSPEEFDRQKAKLLDYVRSPSEPPRGTAYNESDSPTAGVMPKNILEGLKGYSQFKKVACLECGYEGRMGVLSVITPWYATNWAYWGLVIIAILFFRISFVFVLIVFGFIVLMQTLAKKALVACPNCKAKLGPI